MVFKMDFRWLSVFGNWEITLFIDDRLNFNFHVDYIKGKLAQYSGVTYRLSNYFSLHTARTFYYSMIFSLLSYCICIWGGVFMSSHRADQIIRLQNRIMKNLFQRYFINSNCLYRDLCIFKVEDMYKFNSSLYMFKILNFNLYPTLQNCLTLRTLNHSYSTRNIDKFVIPFPRVNCIKTSYKYQFVSIYNELSEYVKSSNTVQNFKTNLRQFILDQY